MTDSKSDGKRLAKNTLLLYMRTFFIMVISLFTSRVVLNSLGVENYGIYNIVGGFVSMFSIISGTLVATTQRFLNFELGKEKGSPQKIFGIAINIHVALILVLFFLMESVGLWFLNTKLQIPDGRMVAANWVFQCSVITFLIGIISAPYSAIIIAHERMSAFAYISLFDVIIKLIVAYLLYLTAHDRLIVYALLLLGASIINPLIYYSYCRNNFPESKYSFVRDKPIYYEMFSFASMNFIGSFASILANQGMNVVLNIFFGVTVNAARGVANQVLGATTKFVNDFMVALNPQITKEYAAGNRLRSRDLCFRGSRFSFFLMLIFAIPICIRAPFILELWLNVYPRYTVEFVRYSFILTSFTLLSNTLITEILATGNLTTTTFWIGGVRLLTLPLAYFIFKCNAGPAYAYVVLIGIEIVSLLVRLKILEVISKMKFIIPFIKEVLSNVLFIAFILLCINVFIDKRIPCNLGGCIAYVSLSVILSLFCIAFLGLDKNERNTIIHLFRVKIISL